jgi:arylsulfatase A-like enzyme
MRISLAPLVVLFSLVPLALAADPTPAAAPRTPNILVIVADDVGFHDVGYHGSEILTPQLDKLAANGVSLEDYYVFPTCSPTRTALLTGRNPSRFGILGPIGGRSTQAVPTDTTTMADVLKSRGYETAQVGKWHLGLKPEAGPRQFGFDRTYGYLHGQIDPIAHLYKNGDRTWHRNDQFFEEPGHVTDLLTAEAVRWIEKPRQQPFFLYLAFSVPHVPLVEEARWTGPYESTIADPSRRLFAASVTHMDAAIGELLAALGRSGQRDNTLIIFTSDNGGQLNNLNTSEYGGKFPAYPVLGNNAPLRGWKGELYEGGIRVPALAVWPGVLTPRKVAAPLSVLDWLPTVADLVGAKISPSWQWEGKNILPQLTGSPPVAARTLYWKTGAATALREGDWKLIESRRGKSPPQLFNLAHDPLEKTDEAASHPEMVARLGKLLAAEQKLDSDASPQRPAK